MSDETRELLYQRKMQRERGESSDIAVSVEEVLANKAKTVRLFYKALLNEGFSEQAALYIIASIPLTEVHAVASPPLGEREQR